MNSLTADMFFKATPVRKTVNRQSELGQFMTPASIAAFMANMFTSPFPEQVRLLDAGAGQGSLTLAFIENWNRCSGNSQLTAHAYEFDDDLSKTMAEAVTSLNEAIEYSLYRGDFIEKAATMIRLSRGPRYTHAILNPPYKKINSASAHRSLLRAAGLETVNLYSGFVGLALDLLENGGELVAIIPRSFCNGPYYQPFRRFIRERAAIRQIHLFDSRNKAFGEDGVLQENIIIHLQKGGEQGEVIISSSHDQSFSDYVQNPHPFGQIVRSDEKDGFIHIPTSNAPDLLDGQAFAHTLSDIGASVSTGPVVDFRMRESLCADPEPDTVPLLYPGHFSGDSMQWPRVGFKKPNAIRYDKSTHKWLYPSGFYSVVRRFSSKEERRRIIANVVDPGPLNTMMIGFENHLNVFHAGRQPLTEDMAHGLSTYLNSTYVDIHFRRFNGHTQVNATDLKTMRYPSKNDLLKLGAWAKAQDILSQESIDAKVAALA